MDLLEFGRSLSRQFEVDDGVDTLGRWMAHYIAETIEKADSASPARRPALQKKAAKLVLDFWSHRYKTVRGIEPLEKFKKVADLLGAIAPASKAASDGFSTLSRQEPPPSLRLYEIAAKLTLIELYCLLDGREIEVSSSTAAIFSEPELAIYSNLGLAFAELMRVIPDPEREPGENLREYLPKLREVQLELLDRAEGHISALRRTLRAAQRKGN